MFYQVMRVQINAAGKVTNNVMDFDSYLEAQKRFYSTIAADIANEDILYHASYIINSLGRTVDVKVFDRRPEKPVDPDEEETENQEE